MKEEAGQTSPAGPSGDSGDDTGLSAVFFRGLPGMVAIVTAVSQPFAQGSTREMLGLPEWAPFVVAVAVSGLLALHRVRIVRRLGLTECAILAPLLAMVIFSAYATGNNAIYYAKEGYSQAGASVSLSQEELEALRSERDILQEKLDNANQLIATFGQKLKLSETHKKAADTATSAVSWLQFLALGRAHAQEPQEPDSQDLQQLQEALRQYEQKQQKLDERLQKSREELPLREDAVDLQKQQQKPLLKSW